MSLVKPKYAPVGRFHKANADRMRLAMTDAEKRLWWALRHRVELSGSHFRRQVSLDGYIADFSCMGSHLIIEVDGGQHYTDEAEGRDHERTAALERSGYRVLRFTNRQVLTEMDVVIDTIVAALGSTLIGQMSATPTPYPSPQGGGERSTSNSILYPPPCGASRPRSGRGGGRADLDHFIARQPLLPNLRD